VQSPRRGRLLDPSLAPSQGERVEQLAQLDGLVVEQILSGTLEQALDFNQDHDEWFVLLQGDAELEVNGESLTLTSGDWMLLPRQTPHRVVRTSPGTSWLAVRGSDR
jgi:cupin 2 domain-containing protein